ncbi:YetF domain-containing protein [Paenibacillus sp. 2KB_20]|uniref:YetF domain-containing protein n=1 Tax=Paenibacillus sp. 2KB_20 TaxID=3232977 RepID=UPI003F9DA9BC
MDMYMDLGVKLVISFFGLWIITFVTGRKTISQLTPLDFLSSLILSEIVGASLYDDKVNIYHLLFALALWTTMSYLFEKATTHFVKFGYLTEGRAVLLIDNGKLNQKLLNKYDMEYKQLLSMLRRQSIFSLTEVKYAILETDGSLSVMRKPEYEPPTAQDMGMEAKADTFTVTVIDKGKLLEESMLDKPIDHSEIKSKAREQGFDSLEEIAYAEYGDDGKLYVYSKREVLE